MRPYFALVTLLAMACESSGTTFVRTPWDAAGTVVVLSLDRSGNAIEDPRVVAAGETVEIERAPGADAVVVLSYPDAVRSLSDKTVAECGIQLADSGDLAEPARRFRATFDALEAGGTFEPATAAGIPPLYFRNCGEAVACGRLALRVRSTVSLPPEIELGGIALSPDGVGYGVGVRGARTATVTERVLVRIYEDRLEVIDSAPVGRNQWFARATWDYGTNGIIGTRSERDANFEVSQEFVPYRWGLDGAFEEYSGLPAIQLVRVGKDGTTFALAEEPGELYEWTENGFEIRSDIERQVGAIGVEDRDWFAYGAAMNVYLWDGRDWEEGVLPVVELGTVGQMLIRREISLAGANTNLWMRMGPGDWALIQPPFESSRPRRLRHAGGDRVLAPSNSNFLAVRTDGLWCQAELPSRSSILRVQANPTVGLVLTNPEERDQSVSWLSYAPPD